MFTVKSASAAGRGTDIVLGGSPKGLAQSILERRLLPLLTNGAAFRRCSRCLALLVGHPSRSFVNCHTRSLPSAVRQCTPEQRAMRFTMILGAAASVLLALKAAWRQKVYSKAQDSAEILSSECNQLAVRWSENPAGKDKGETQTVFPAFDSAERMERSLPPQLLRALQTAEGVTATRWALQPATHATQKCAAMQLKFRRGLSFTEK